ncbi:hypothetical protein NWI01_19850 [Nitrobacter winogradskyi]|uniref:Uncharacterized protein n=1 Tax=Nitrobacter winogradskyi TaxID=913 RepID=A0A4Y3WAW7_NITWI|nr:hypothetical protein NWI01_19850 [Nitrobacter winogradskyi]
MSVDHPGAEATGIACNGVERREKAANANATLRAFIIVFSMFFPPERGFALSKKPKPPTCLADQGTTRTGIGAVARISAV